jgi:hypothetical protein
MRTSSLGPLRAPCQTEPREKYAPYPLLAVSWQLFTALNSFPVVGYRANALLNKTLIQPFTDALLRTDEQYDETKAYLNGW